MCIASGVFFSAHRFPDSLLLIIRLLPSTAAVDALRGNMLQGSKLMDVAPELGVRAAWAVLCFAIALRLFHWR